ncbi:MAG: 16S rRNA (uracil(1498)-N(3))-methyltransferase [Cellulomonadaceae bacterium]|nr:16S rRNA (uracil(1498)-N(3))-methyltransferase [Cellulomonadaceae bacterium]
MSAPVFLAEPGSLDGHGPGSSYVLEGEEARHAGIVQRRRAGERIDVADGAGVRLTCTIATVEPGRLVLDVVQRDDEPTPAVQIVLVQALAKGDRDEMAIEAATEVGVDEVVPWQAQRSVVVWRGDRAAKSRARWLATVRAAAKQSRRSRVPVVATAVTTTGLAARVAQVVADGGLALVLHEEADAALTAVPVGLAGQREVLLVVGPEGGISSEEVDLLTAAGASTVRLGPHVLRTSTAGPVAVALVCARLGRWG